MFNRLKSIFSASIVYGVVFYSIISFGFSSTVESYNSSALFYTILAQLRNTSGHNGVFYDVEIPKFTNNDRKNPTNESFDSSFNVIDTSEINADTLYYDDFTDPRDRDSTARLSHFKYSRKDKPYIPFHPQKKSSFFTSPSQNIAKRVVEIDSTGLYVIVKEMVGQNEVKNRLKIPIDDYIRMRLESNQRRLWEELAYAYELKEGKKDLSEFLSNITEIQIPVPGAKFLSIFGPQQINLKINGVVDIHGAWRNETTEGLTASMYGNTRNEPDFKQEVQINVDGTIGDKLKIMADWQTQRTFEYENQLKITYTGYEDEIIKKIEAGNVSLQTSPLVGGSEALFGVKAEFQMGPFSLITLASQKKGEIKEMTVSSGATEQTFDIKATNYSMNHYFVDEVYADTTPERNFFYKYYGLNQYNTHFYTIKEIEVWKSTVSKDNLPNIRKISAFIDLEPRAQSSLYSDELRFHERLTSDEGKFEAGDFIRLTEGVDYNINKDVGMITFKSGINENDQIAVAYRIDGPTVSSSDDIFYGEFLKDHSNTKDTLVLKLVKPKNLQPKFEKAWALQLKNIYGIGGGNIRKENFEFDIYYQIEGGEQTNVLEGVRLLNAFGLDVRNSSGERDGRGDGIFDFVESMTIIQETGEIVFPKLQPFGRNLPTTIPNPDTIRFNDLYDLSKNFAQMKREKDKFVFKGKYTGVSSNKISIGYIGVVEGSVRVYLGGRELKEGIDYTVDYNIGHVIIRNDAALVPGANLKVTYEQNDLFQLASKTMLGARGIYNFSDKTKLGFSALNLKQETLSDKVRLGEEPISNAIYGVDFNTSGDLPFLTKTLDKIYSTKTMSEFNFRGEFAYINPDPNTKKSTIASDRGESIAYLDDFEGVKRTIPLGGSYTSWKDISVPDAMKTIVDEMYILDKMKYKAKAFWYNLIPSGVRVVDIWGVDETGQPRKRVARGEDEVQVLDFVFRPNKRGSYNYNLVVDTNNSNDIRANWGGMMKALSSTANNLLNDNIEFIEFWLSPINAPQGSKFFIDLGKISEDIIPNRQRDTEDKNLNDRLDEGEDVGIDGVSDKDEPGYDPMSNPDPAGDNFSFVHSAGNNPDNYENINGTEGNSKLIDAGGIYPDDEDINRNGYLDQVNSYFRYEVPLDTSDNPYIKGGGASSGSNNWFFYRIPIKEFHSKVGDPSFTTVDMIRVWVNGVEEQVHIRFVEFNLVGNQWNKGEASSQDTLNDPTITISVVNIEDNYPIYTSPPGVQRERDKTKPDENILRNEQSLALIIRNLEEGDHRVAEKNLGLRPLDVFNYKEMKLFVHGDMNPAIDNLSYYENDTNYNADFYIRFGADKENFYEYRQPVKPDWNEVSIIFSELTALKQSRDSVSKMYYSPVAGQPGHYYGIKGKPTLTRISYFQLGILNVKEKGYPGPISGEVWVNELRVLGADDTPGWAYSFSTSVKFADLMTVNFNTSRTDPYFHRISDRFGSRNDSKSWGASVDFDVLKIIPFDMTGSNLRLNYSRTEQVQRPLYVPGTDIKVDQAARELKAQSLESGMTEEEANKIVRDFESTTQSISTSNTWTLSGIKLRAPSNYWLIRDTWNAMTFNFNYNNSWSRSPTIVQNKSWGWNASANHAVSLNPDYWFYVGNTPFIGTIIDLFFDYRNVKLFYTPQSFRSGITANRKFNYSQSRDQTGSASKPAYSRDFVVTRNAGFTWKLTEGGFFNPTIDYKLDLNSTLSYLLGYEDYSVPESQIWKEIFTGAHFGRNQKYGQNFDLRFNPRLPSLWDISKFFTLSMGYSAQYTWNNDISRPEVGRSANYRNNISIGTSVKLKSLFAPLFTSDQTTGGGLKTKTPKPTSDSLSISGDTVRKGLGLIKAWAAIKDGFHWLLIDYDNIRVNFSQSNSQSGGALYGKGIGFSNFWGYQYKPEFGPSRLFMLGLSNDLGPRVPRAQMLDNFNQNNQIDLSTSKPLWQGAQIDLKWNLGWKYDKTVSLAADEFGNISVQNTNHSGTLNRSFLSFPPFFFLSMFKSGIKTVKENYNQNAPNPAENLSNAFVEGFESARFLSKLGFLSSIIKYIPRPNWNLNWSGLEKSFIFKNLAKSVSLNHAYTSTYNEGWKINPDGIREVSTQKISYAFQPLVGLNMTFNSLWNGNLTGNIKYSTKNDFDLGTSTRKITESFSRDIGFTLSYSKSGFEIPLFGLSLKNDIEISISYTSGKNSKVVYDMNEFKEDGEPLDGAIRTIIEPKLKYIVSSKVTVTLFYKRISTEPEGASRLQPTTTNEAGLDVRILIR